MGRGRRGKSADLRSRAAAGLLAAGLLAAAPGCTVDRDLDPSRFACAQGGPCDGGAGPGADAGGVEVDAGTLDLSACVGVYSGTSFGVDPGSIEASLSADGRLNLVFTTLRYFAGLGVVTQVAPDLSLGLVSPPTVTLSGSFDAVRCTAQGTWSTDEGTNGRWNVERDG